jgi:hypothetical protein
MKQNQPSFRTAQKLQSHIEALPDVPKWSHQTITISGYRTKDLITLYWHNRLEVIKSLFSNPIFADGSLQTG